jgi:hypothetical protein
MGNGEIFNRKSHKYILKLWIGMVQSMGFKNLDLKI